MQAAGGGRPLSNLNHIQVNLLLFDQYLCVCNPSYAYMIIVRFRSQIDLDFGIYIGNISTNICNIDTNISNIVTHISNMSANISNSSVYISNTSTNISNIDY